MGARKVRLKTEDWIAKARAVHGDRYNYSRVQYLGLAKDVEIICPEHGPFWQRAGNHTNRASRCPQCAGFAPTTLEQFLARARQIHGDKYDYSLVEYHGVQKRKVKILCPEHGVFEQLPMTHMQGRGCNACGAEQCVRRKSNDWFIGRAREVHGDRYDYSRVQYQRSLSKVTITCPDHGDFEQVAAYHLNGNGCQQCAPNTRQSREQFVVRANKTHNSRYRYGPYSRMHDKATIICREHGAFEQIAKDHTDGHGCPQCAAEATTSEHESALSAWLRNMDLTVVRNDRALLDGMEIDIYLPEQKIGIEFQGAYWHNDIRLPHPRLHEHKQNRADAAGIRLISVWDFDWLKRRPMVEQHLLHALGRSEMAALDARKLRVERVEPRMADAFYAATHIQGKTSRANRHYGLFAGELVACMSFGGSGNRRKKAEQGEWELTRFSTIARVRGGASRLFTRFLRDMQPTIVWSFSDRQHFSGNLYPALGFHESARLRADYRVIYQPPLGRIWHKSEWQKRLIPTRLAEINRDIQFDPECMTERQAQDAVGAMRIMDSGKIRWLWSA